MLEDEDILQMTHAGLVKITIVNDFLATFWKQLLSGLTIHEDVVIKRRRTDRAPCERTARC